MPKKKPENLQSPPIEQLLTEAAAGAENKNESADGLQPEKWYELMNERADLLARLAAQGEHWSDSDKSRIEPKGFGAVSRIKRRLNKINEQLIKIDLASGAALVGRDWQAEFNQVVDNDEKFSLMLEKLQWLKQEQTEAAAQEYAIISEGRNSWQGVSKADRDALQEIRREQRELSGQENFWKSAPEIAPFYRMAVLETYRQALQSKNFVETPSRRKLAERMKFHIENSEPILLEGGTGTGKTELALNLCRKLYGREPEFLSGSPDVRASDLMVKQGLRASETANKAAREELAREISEHIEQYKQEHPQATAMDVAQENDNYARIVAASAGVTPETYFVYGPLVRAMEAGLPLIIDEANLIEPRLRMVLKRIYNAKPGNEIPLAGDGKIKVAAGFCLIFTANLKSEKHTERFDFDEAEKRVMINSTIHVDYLPPEELYDLLLAKAMDSRGEAQLSRKEAETVLKNFCDAVAAVQTAYGDKPSEIYAPKDARGKQQEFKEGVLDPGAALRMLNGLEAKNADEPLVDFLNHSIFNYVSNRNYNPKDRELIVKIFMSKGFLQTIGVEELEIPGLEASALSPFRTAAAAADENGRRQIAELNRRQLAELDPYGLRKIDNTRIGAGFMELPGGEDNQEADLENRDYQSIIKVKHYIKADSQEREIHLELDFEGSLAQTKKFYEDHGIDLSPNFEAEARDIWLRNYEAIKKEMADNGYDHILIIPDTLPGLEGLNAKMTVGYEATYCGGNFVAGGSFNGARDSRSKSQGCHLTLVHWSGAKNLADHPLLKATKGKSPEQLTGKTRSDIETIISGQGDLPIKIQLADVVFGSDKNNINGFLQAEGLTLAEYLILQRQFFEATQEHLDGVGWTWLLATFSASRLAYSSWNPDRRRLDVYAVDGGLALIDLGCRPSRSFR
ncbi:MAG: hypothetical protein WC517_04425 [Patescibacteria group bacterium]